MKKVACVLGSPRKNGNTATVAARFAETAQSLGAQTQTFVLNELSFKGCQACMACKTGSDKCVVKDDLADVLDAAREADVLVMASPIYFAHMTGQMKCFIDRTYSFFVPDFFNADKPTRLAPGKKCVLILAQADPNGGHFDIYPEFAEILQWMGYETHKIRGLGWLHEAGDAELKDALQQAQDLAKQVLA